MTIHIPPNGSSTIPWGSTITGLSSNTTGTTPINPNNVQFKDTTITGQMFTAEIVLSDAEVQSLIELHSEKGMKAEMKMRLVQKMAEHLFKSDCFEFGMQQNYAEFKYYFRSRIYVTPSSQTTVVRQILNRL